jgi:hypothetical protein
MITVNNATSCSVTRETSIILIVINYTPKVINYTPKVINYTPKVINYTPKVINYTPKVILASLTIIIYDRKTLIELVTTCTGLR